ncbi:MAG TPA: hypothetical protein DFI00_08250 [Rhodospirillaceae bacterium]|nr:hypothetical protein [Alphaproteobacteria bacterium]OUT42371.1 MAG: hypothetical protein CBB62_08835 [Micavibrio sp. TMED2]HCI47271.1 hypothetical protein [Rhodospirillaceae bacterium]MAS45994.1 hypothetical protein [Alphaproteobacteria bacterium]MAX95824.1 hypothetical protein [Alphaproteobacteria bacterium]|tara:strand:- start:3108 stop:3425 length:318 start_codon:yes stop_codon:yes gene_type:complete
MDPFSRRVLVDEVLGQHATWEPDGEIDYTSPIEPVFRDWATMQLVTLNNQIVPGGSSEPLRIDITEGNLVDYPPVPAPKPPVPGQNNSMIVAAIVGLIIIAAATR